MVSRTHTFNCLASVLVACLCLPACDGDGTEGGAIVVVEDPNGEVTEDSHPAIDSDMGILDSTAPISDASAPEADMNAGSTGRRVLHEVFPGLIAALAWNPTRILRTFS